MAENNKLTDNEQKVADISKYKSNRPNDTTFFSNTKNIFFIILCILIVVMLYRVVNDSTIPTFESLLTTLSNLEVVKIDFSFGLSNVLPYWLGWLGTLWDIVSFALNGILVVIQYAFHFVAWIFA